MALCGTDCAPVALLLFVSMCSCCANVFVSSLPHSYCPQIVSVNRVRLENLCHQDVISMFQTTTEVELVVMPVQYSKATAVRINPGNPLSLSYLWCLTRTLQSLEVV